MNKYKGRMILNQRGGSIVINNTTEEESVQISQRSGSNILLNNVTNSELATNNKQTLVINDNFTTVKKDDSSFVGGNRSVRVGKNNYELKGFNDDSEIESYQKWHDTFKEIALTNSKFKIKRGGESLPNGTSTEQSGSRASNPVLKNKILSVENKFNGYSGVPIRSRFSDEVSFYSKVPDAGNTRPASVKDITLADIQKSAGESGSSAPGVMKYGASKSAATEEGNWSPDTDAQQIGNLIILKQDELSIIEKLMGDAGDDILITKRNKSETIGASFNDYPSVRIDPEGRSQPFEMLVSDTGVFKNHDYTPLVEEIDNSSNYPCGNDSKIIGNSYRRNVGSGGISLKTTGNMEIGAATAKLGAKKININASHGLQLASDSLVEIQSLKSIVIRSNRQVLVESSLGIKDNVIIGGATYTEGETYLHHITAPLEVQQTQDTVTYGQFNARENRTLLVSETLIAGTWYPSYAIVDPDLIVNYSHSHHFNNVPLRLMESNKEVRDIAQTEGINIVGNKNQALPQIHERKLAQRVD